MYRRLLLPSASRYTLHMIVGAGLDHFLAQMLERRPAPGGNFTSSKQIIMEPRRILSVRNLQDVALRHRHENQGIDGDLAHRGQSTQYNYCPKVFTHTPALVQHEKSHLQGGPNSRAANHQRSLSVAQDTAILSPLAGQTNRSFLRTDTLQKLQRTPERNLTDRCARRADLSCGADGWVFRIVLQKQLRLMRSPFDLHAIFTKIALAESREEACTEIMNLCTVVVQKQMLVPAPKLRRMRVCLNADDAIWCPQVEEHLVNLETHCRALAKALKQGLAEADWAVHRAVATAEGMASNLSMQRKMLIAADNQVSMLSAHMQIATEGRKRMRQFGSVYADQAEATMQKFGKHSVESVQSGYSEGASKRPKLSDSGTDKPITSRVNDFLSPEMSNKDTDALLEEAMLMDHDLVKERVLTELAAEQHNPIAIARCIQSGWGGMPSDPCEAFQMFMAFHESSRTAQCCLGECLEYGFGTEANPAEAYEWYRKSAKAGFPRAQYALGACYRDGVGAVVSGAQACKWFLAASKQGHARAHVCLGSILQLAKQNRSSFECFLKAAELGHRRAECWIGDAFHKGLHGVVTVNKATAFEWFTKAAEHGDTQAQFYLGLYHIKGIATPVDERKGSILLLKAARHGHTCAKNCFIQIVQSLKKRLDQVSEAGKKVGHFTSQLVTPCTMSAPTRVPQQKRTMQPLETWQPIINKPPTLPPPTSLAGDFANRLYNLKCVSSFRNKC